MTWESIDSERSMLQEQSSHAIDTFSDFAAKKTENENDTTLFRLCRDSIFKCSSSCLSACTERKHKENLLIQKRKQNAKRRHKRTGQNTNKITLLFINLCACEFGASKRTQQKQSAMEWSEVNEKNLITFDWVSPRQNNIRRLGRELHCTRIQKISRYFCTVLMFLSFAEKKFTTKRKTRKYFVKKLPKIGENWIWFTFDASVSCTPLVTTRKTHKEN